MGLPSLSTPEKWDAITRRWVARSPEAGLGFPRHRRCYARTTPKASHVRQALPPRPPSQCQALCVCGRRRWRDNVGVMGSVQLLLIDEVHVLGEDRGAVLETVRLPPASAPASCVAGARGGGRRGLQVLRWWRLGEGRGANVNCACSAAHVASPSVRGLRGCVRVGDALCAGGQPHGRAHVCLVQFATVARAAWRTGGGNVRARITRVCVAGFCASLRGSRVRERSRSPSVCRPWWSSTTGPPVGCAPSP